MDEPRAPARTPPTAHTAHTGGTFLAGCDLPSRWHGLAQWRILDTGFGSGIGFLTTWHAWRADPHRPRMLHYVAIDAHPVSRDDLTRGLSTSAPELAGLSTALAEQWHGLLPGFHRLAFDDCQVLLTLCIGDVRPMLRAQRFDADSIFFDGFGPQGDVVMASPDTLKALSRFARRGTRIAARTTGMASRTVRDALAQNGFRMSEPAASSTGADLLEGDFAPAWTVRRRAPPPAPVDTPGHCAVIGAGLAGAAVAASLVRRGWRVTVLDAAPRAAAGASGVPVAVLAPHVSPDDALLSRLTRAGLRLTWQQVEALLREGRDWRSDGVLERRAAGDDRLPAGWNAEGPHESRHATPARLREAGLGADSTALWHARAGWVKPARLIEAWLDRPGVRLRTGARVARIDSVVSANGAARWALRDSGGGLLADEADRVVIAAGFESAPLAPRHPLQPVRGQVAWGRMTLASNSSPMSSMPQMPLNGDGHLIAHVPDPAGAFWLTGATFDRDRSDAAPSAADTEANRVRLARLHPGASASLAQAFAACAAFTAFERQDRPGSATVPGSDAVHAWTGVRCASADRRPLVGPLDVAMPDGPWLCTAMGSRGLTFAVLCAELLAARWHGEPLPLPTGLAGALDAGRAGR